MTEPRYVVITPVRDEADYIGRTIDSMVRQTLRPVQWVIVDDGSSDDTLRIATAAADSHGWISVVQRRDRGRRLSGGGVVEAFYDGYRSLSEVPWDFVVKLDGDLSFDDAYFRLCLDCFGAEPRLGIGGGTVCKLENGDLVVDSIGDPPFHVRGATKIYRRACWEQIEPLVQAPGWDTIDEVKANMKGWSTRTYPDLRVVQHKPTGAADGTWLNFFKNGRANYVSGYDPLFMLAKCVKRTFGVPPLIPAVALGAGFCSAYFKGTPQVQDAEVIRYLRRQQRRHLIFRTSIYR